MIITFNDLKNVFLMSDQQIEIFLSLPVEEQMEFLTERKMRIDIMNAIIQSGGDVEYAKSIINDPTVNADA